MNKVIITTSGLNLRPIGKEPYKEPYVFNEYHIYCGKNHYSMSIRDDGQMEVKTTEFVSVKNDKLIKLTFFKDQLNEIIHILKELND